MPLPAVPIVSVDAPPPCQLRAASPLTPIPPLGPAPGSPLGTTALPVSAGASVLAALTVALLMPIGAGFAGAFVEEPPRVNVAPCPSSAGCSGADGSPSSPNPMVGVASNPIIGGVTLTSLKRPSPVPLSNTL